MSDMLKRLWSVDNKSLNVVLWGQAGSGKTFFVETTLKQYLRQSKDKNERFVYISPKNEGFEDYELVLDIEDIPTALSKNRVVRFYPQDMDFLEQDIDSTIDLVFRMQAKNPKSTYIVIIDDAQIGLSSRKAASGQLKRLALTGRSRGIRGVFIAHNIVLNRELEGQVDLLVGFSNPNPTYYKQSIERFEFDPAPFAEPMLERPYSFVWYDMRTKNPILMSPIASKKSDNDV